MSGKRTNIGDKKIRKVIFTEIKNYLRYMT